MVGGTSLQKGDPEEQRIGLILALLGLRASPPLPLGVIEKRSRLLIQSVLEHSFIQSLSVQRQVALGPQRETLDLGAEHRRPGEEDPSLFLVLSTPGGALYYNPLFTDGLQAQTGEVNFPYSHS